MFYFQQLLNTALGGIDATNVIPAVSNMAFAILLIGFLIGLYQAVLRGGDLQALAVTAIKYLVVAMIVANWSTVFRDVNGSFNTVASFIGNSSGAGDMFINWMTQLQQQAQTNPNLTFWDMITGDAAGAITVGMLLIAYVIYALAIIVFCFFYTLFGSVLYVLGPLVLALIPISGIGQLGKTYAINVMIWNAWGILYAVFGALITAIHFNQVSDVLGNGFLGFLRGVPDSVILGLVSIAYALAIALVPFIARKGDFRRRGINRVRLCPCRRNGGRRCAWPEQADLRQEPAARVPVPAAAPQAPVPARRHHHWAPARSPPQPRRPCPRCQSFFALEFEVQ